MTRAERGALLAGGLGWMLDAFDVMLYSMVLADLISRFGMSKSIAGLLGSLTLVASAIGGFYFGFVADRVGRTRSLSISILVYSLASAACGFSQNIIELGIFRFILGLGMGGEWAAGAALVAETWPAEHRGKALGVMQSTWAIGEMLAALVALSILPHYGWRAVFFVGVLPGLLAFWIQRRVPEPEIWQRRKAKAGGAPRVPLNRLWAKDIRWTGIIATAMNACGMFGYWGLFIWMPAYFSLPVADGGRGLSLTKTMAWLVVTGVGKWLGYALFGFVADLFGRRRTYFAYLFIAAIVTPLYGWIRDPLWLLALGPVVAFFGTGFFSGFPAIASEIFPPEIRATAMGLSYNFGRGVSAFAPPIIGALADVFGLSLGHSFIILGAAFFLGALLTLALPETRGKELE